MLTDRQQGAAQSACEPPSKAGILLVEDEDQLRELMGTILGASGFTVFAAESGPEALKMWRENREVISLLFTDIVLPENLSGIEIAESVSSENPELPIVITSGYRLDSIADAEKIRQLGRFVPKPYVPTEVTRMFKEILAV